MRLALLTAVFAGILSGCALQPPSIDRPAQSPSASPGIPDQAALFVANATAMLGQPYRYGAAQPGGFDCSGLVAYAASRSGIELPRTAQEQERAGVALRRSELRAGDLVFMRLKGKDLHVGIALDARRFVHAPATGGRVRIDSLEQAPYSTGFAGARRIVEARAAR